MGLWKKYPKSKDARKRMKKFYGAKDVSPGCHNDGTCDWCRNNRTISTQRRKGAADNQIKERE